MNRSTAGSPTLALCGGTPECPGPWPVWPVVEDTERRLVAEVLDSGRWWFGERVRQFEAEYAQFQGSRFAVTCTNGTTAIEMGLRALGVVPGDEVIVPPYSFIATASAVVTVGAIPVFADIESGHLGLDPIAVEQRLTSKTRAIIPVHVGGTIGAMPRLLALARERGLAVLEDAAHAWGSELNHRGAGVLGQAGTFSFQVSKNITAGEGGILVTDDAEVADLCRSYTHCGRRRDSAWYDHDELGSNLRLTEFQAAVLLAQLSRLPAQITRREISARILDQALAGLPGLSLLAPAPAMTRRSYHMYIFRVDPAVLGIPRDRFLEALTAEGVPASKGWYRPLYANGVFQRAHEGPPHGIRSPMAHLGIDYRHVHCPVCEQVCRDAVWIPQHVLLAEPEAVQGAARSIAKVVEGAAQLRGRT